MGSSTGQIDIPNTAHQVDFRNDIDLRRITIFLHNHQHSGLHGPTEFGVLSAHFDRTSARQLIKVRYCDPAAETGVDRPYPGGDTRFLPESST